MELLLYETITEMMLWVVVIGVTVGVVAKIYQTKKEQNIKR